MTYFIDGFLLIIFLFTLTQIEPSQINLATVVATAISAGWLIRSTVGYFLWQKPVLACVIKLWINTSNYLKMKVTGIALLFTGAILVFALLKTDAKTDAKDILNTIGTLGAGIGTIGLLLIALIKGNEWAHAAKLNKRLEIAIAEAKSLLIHCYKLSQVIHQELEEEKVNSIAQKKCTKDAIDFLKMAQDSCNDPAKDILICINMLNAIYGNNTPEIVDKIDNLRKNFSHVIGYTFIIEGLEYGKLDLNGFVIETQKVKENATNLCLSVRKFITEITQHELS